MNLDLYDMRSMQNAKSLLIQARNEGLSIHDTISVIDEHLLRISPSIHRPRNYESKRVEYCPSCGKGPYITLPVNDSPATHVGGQWKAMKLCRNCHHEEWIKK